MNFLPNAAALVIAGGRGTRFWPLSRGGRPKSLFSLNGKSTLLAGTIARLMPLIPRQRIFVIIAADQTPAFLPAVRGLIPPGNLLIEPEGRGTTVAIAYGAAMIQSRLGPATVAIVPADHHVVPPGGFRRTLGRALRIAAKDDAVVILGVPAIRAETGYGYQKIGSPVGDGFIVERFVEKPALAEAKRMVRSGKYLWNAGIFVVSGATLAREISAHCPALADALPKLTASSARKLADNYRRLDFDSFDREIVEKSSRVITVRADFRWFDVGSWDGVWEASRGRDGNVISGSVMALDCQGVVARANGRLIVMMGLNDLIAVDAGDAILLARRSSSQDVRRITEELRRRGMKRYL
ncbi:MAG: mannose-1-phosphate guanylyltransferase [Candidatus Binataceae bacterium]